MAASDPEDMLVAIYLLMTLPQGPLPAPERSVPAEHTILTLTGLRARERFGTAVSAAGDVDRDGATDVLVGGVGPYGQPGCLYLFSGDTGELIHKWMSSALHDQFGRVVCGALDIDSDGTADAVVGAPATAAGGPDAGRIVVYSGRDGRELATVMGSAPGEAFGSALAGVGDLDRDGYADLAVSAPGDNQFSGRVDVYSGRWLAQRVGAPHLLRIQGSMPDRNLGSALAAADLDRDGHVELVVGASHDDTRASDAGAVDVYSTRTGYLLQTVLGDVTCVGLGTTVCVPGDVDGDGHADIAAGAPWSSRANSRTGYLLLHSFKQASRLHGIYGSGDLSLGRALAPVGDVDGDGRADVLVGSVDDWTPSRSAACVTILSGRSGRVLLSFGGASLGWAVAGVSDVNGDRVPDFVAGAPYEPASSAGAIRIVSTAPLSLLADVHSISTAAGGAQRLVVSAGSEFAHRFYIVLGSTSGCRPGVRLGSLHVPLNLDEYTRYTLAYPNTIPLIASMGQLDVGGRAFATFRLPGANWGNFELTLHHACLMLDQNSSGVAGVSNPVPLRLH